MSIKKYISEKDTTIADAYKADLKTRSTDANLGASDSLEVFSIYGQASQNSLEKSRILVQFPIDQLVADRSDSKIPQSGSVNFFFRLFKLSKRLNGWNKLEFQKQAETDNQVKPNFFRCFLRKYLLSRHSWIFQIYIPNII